MITQADLKQFNGTEQYLSYIEEQKDKQKLREMTLIIDGIEKAKVEDLIEL